MRGKSYYNFFYKIDHINTDINTNNLALLDGKVALLSEI